MINDELLHKWVSGDLTSEELKIFEKRPEYESLVRLYENTAMLQAPEFDTENVLVKVLAADKNTKKEVPRGRRIFLSSWFRYGVAASLLLVAGWFFWAQNTSPTVYELAKGAQTEGQLPDGSTFLLNAESKLTFSSDSWSENRLLTLEGEAFFEVKKGAKFTVKTPQGSVQVLGTAFNVRERKDQLEVICQSGKVAILATDGNTLKTIEKGEAVRVSNNQIVDEWITSVGQSSWQDGIFRFRKVELQSVLDELERQFDIRVVATGIDTQTILSCNFQNKDLNTALKTVLGPLLIKHTIKDENTVFLSK